MFMTNKELFNSLCERYDFKIMNLTPREGYAIPKSNRLHFSGYIIKYTEDNIYVAGFPDIEDTTVYFCNQLPINDDLDIHNHLMTYLINPINQKEKELKELDNQKELEAIKKDF